MFLVRRRVIEYVIKNDSPELNPILHRFESSEDALSVWCPGWEDLFDQGFFWDAGEETDRGVFDSCR